MNTKNTTTNVPRLERSGHLRWVAVSEIHTNERGQRDLRPGWAAQIAAEFDPDRFLPPLLSLRAGKFYVIDGQHRVEAMRLMGGDRQVQCWVYEGIDEAQEADLFLWHNNRKAVGAFDKFRVAVTAERAVEVDINRIVMLSGLKIGNNGHAVPGSIGCVSTLRAIYAHGPSVLARTLKIANSAYGDDGLAAATLHGIGLVCARYESAFDDAEMVRRLSTARGGIGALNSRAHTARKALGKAVPHCYAASVVDIYNSVRGGKKLPNWWA